MKNNIKICLSLILMSLSLLSQNNLDCENSNSNVRPECLPRRIEGLRDQSCSNLQNSNSTVRLEELRDRTDKSGQQKPPLTEAEAAAMLQVAGGFLQILTNPNNQVTVTNGIGVMATGMANLFYQLMKSRGIDAQLSDIELQNLAEEMAQIVNRSVEIELLEKE